VAVTEVMAIGNLYDLVAGQVVCIAIDAERKHSVRTQFCHNWLLAASRERDGT